MALVEDDSPDASDSHVTSWLILSIVQPVLVGYNGLKFREVTPCGKANALCTGVVVPEVANQARYHFP